MTTRNEQLADQIGNIGNAFETFQAKHDNFIAEHKVTQAEIIDRLEDLEAKASRPRKESGGVSEHMKLFSAWLKKPHDEKTRTELGNFQSDLERKDVTIASLPGGGYSVPE